MIIPSTPPSRQVQKEYMMEAIRISAGSSVLVGPTHGGIERMSAGVAVAHRILSAALRGLDVWHENRVAAHNASLAAQLASQDHRVLEELRAVYCRSQSQNDR